jgi:protein phosphatase
MAEREASWENLLQHVALTHVGMRRANNQDSHSVVLATDMDEWRTRGHVLMVADGMGAHAAGELASKLAADGIPHLYRKYADQSPPEALQKAILETNGLVYQKGQANSEFRNMGTTASTLVLLPQGALVGHIGDSRVYRVRGGKLEQITFDHSLVWELREAGQLSENAELANAIPKNVITRSIGPNANVQVDIEGPMPIEVGDTFLLCSDGLTARLTDEELAAFLAHLPPSEAGQLLLDLTNLRGGPDNITVIIAKVVGEELASNESSAEPLKIGAKSPNVGLQLGLLVAFGVFLLAALLLAVIGQLQTALIALGVSLVVVVAGLLARTQGMSKGIELGTGRKLGSGPYTETPCPTPAEVADKLAEITGELRGAPAAENLDLDWGDFDSLCQSSAKAREGDLFGQAIGESAKAVCLLMTAVHQARAADDASDSEIEL